MGQPKISVIVPVYNAGIHFDKCLKSLVNQTLKEIEIILVLDCPTDGSDKVAEKYAAADSRIKLIYNNESLHTGLSRNKGMRTASGKYIGFLDHDDYCDSLMFELLYRRAEELQSQVVRCNYSCIYITKSGEREEQYVYPDIASGISDRKWIYEYVCGDKISCVIWNHIYRADFLKENNILFLDSREICSEDSVFFLEVYNRANSLGTIPDYLYYHVFHSKNTGKMYDYRSIKNRISFFETLYSFLRKNSVDENKCFKYLSENAARSLYSGSRQALLKLPLSKAMTQIMLIRRDKLIMNFIDYLYKKENSSILYKLKPTIILFFSILRRLK